MKRSIGEYPPGPSRQGFTLVELVCTMAVIGILAAMVLPVISQGYARARRAYCVNSLRQMGLAFHSFAHSHGDRFPIQVPVNAGGSQEYLQAGYAVNGEFFFSYRHFQPLAAELVSPKPLTCPSDTRIAATNFDFLANSNLSYFVGGNPQMGQPESVLAGGPEYRPDQWQRGASRGLPAPEMDRGIASIQGECAVRGWACGTAQWAVPPDELRHPGQ